MNKPLAMTCVLVPLFFACGDSESKNTADAAVSTDTAAKLDAPKGSLDAAGADVAAKTDVAAIQDVSQKPDQQPIDVPREDVPVVDAPAVDAAADAGTDGGDALAGNATGCERLPITNYLTNIDNPVIWPSNRVTRIDRSIVINAQVIIEPGAIVKLAKGTSITFGPNGSMVTLGVSNYPRIVFTSITDDAHGGDTNNDCNATSPAPGDWGSIKITGTSSLFKFTDFYYGGGSKPYSGAVSVINNGKAWFDNCVFAYNTGGKLDDTRAAALNLGGSAYGTSVAGSLFYANDIPVVINALIDFDNSNTFAFTDPVTKATLKNTYNGIFMDGVAHTVSGMVGWSNTQVPYVLYQVTMTIADGGHLDVLDGVVVKNYKNRIDVAELGTLNADAATFTSFLDDSKLGDTNADGTTSAPTKGDWTGINVCKPLCKASAAGNILYASNF